MLSFVLVITLLLANNALAEKNPSIFNLNKSLRQFTVTYETFNITAGESIGVAAIRFERKVNSFLFLGPELDGSITGKRSGYVGLGINLGMLLLNKKNIQIANRIFFGGCGGGSMNQYSGGGMTVKVSGELIIPMTKAISIRTELGYIRFLNGTISSRLLSGGISYKYYKVSSK